MPCVMQLFDFYIWVDELKGNLKIYNLILVMPLAQMSLEDLLKNTNIKLTFD